MPLPNGRLRQGPAGTYHGLAQFMGYGSYVAACAEVSVSTDGRLKIHRIVAATNPGHAVTRPRSSARSPARSSMVSPRRSTAKSRSMRRDRADYFDSYNVMRIDEMRSRGRHHADWRFLGGVGEPTIAVAAPRCSTRSSQQLASAYARCR